ncbi:DNA polymerase III subunit chi [Pseudomonas phoenicis]|uniref:DNA polymerase III subunit chi n=1 Tax=unclassified Pseudomonas TaxID=196821 RepID=UPI00399EF345
MDKPMTSPNHSAHLLDDLESIRELLGDADLQPPLLTETVEPAPSASAAQNSAASSAKVSAGTGDLHDAQARRQDTLLHLDSELRAAAQSIMQDVINDFTPHIETEIKRRLAVRMERLLNAKE